MRPAGFWRRFAAYLLDVLPITLVVAAIFYSFLGFDRTIARYLHGGPRDHPARAAFLRERNQIRNLSLVVYIVYAAAFEASALKATPGKRLLGMRVTDAAGGPAGVGQAVVRNTTKLVSAAPCGLGFLWAAWSPQKRAWHDYAAGTRVVTGGN